MRPRELKLDRADVTPDLTGVYHNVLRFSNTTYNTGQGAVIVDAQINPTTRSGPATQRVTNSDGTFTDYPLGTNIYWHEAHHHYHFDNWGRYELWTKSAYDAWIASGRTTGAPSYTGTKTTSCIIDEEFVARNANSSAYGTSSCDVDSQNQIHMGLSPGWGDTYDWYRQEQWIDLNQDTLANGTYVLRSVADPNNMVYESANKGDPTRESIQDNEATTTFAIAGGAIVDGSAPTGTVSIAQSAPSTSTPNVYVDVIGRDDVSGVNQFRLSNDGTHFTTFAYTTSGSVPTEVAWNLSDPATGGTSANGMHTVYAQAHDYSGKWGPTFTDTIDLQVVGPPPPPPPPGSYAPLVKGDRPAGYWRLGEVSGAAADSAGSNPGSYNGAVTRGAAGLLTGDADKAAAFPGTSESVIVPNSTSLSLTTAVSVEAWIKPASLPAAGAFRSVTSKPEAYSLQFNGPRLEFTIIQAGGVRRRLQAPAGAIVAGRVYHVVGTYDGATQRLYIDGAQSGAVALTGAISSNANPLIIASWSGWNEFFAGTVDEAAVYPVALTATQVTNHYAAGTSTTPPPPVQLTVSKSGAGSGTVTSAPAGISCATTCAASFPAGSRVTLSAAAASGSSFGGWSGGGCSGTATCVVTLNAATTVTATFGTSPPPPVQLTVSKSGAGSGTVTSAPAGINCGTTCAASFPAGSQVTLSAAAASGSSFGGWSGGGCSGTATCVVTLSAATTVTATFGTSPPPPGSYAPLVKGDRPAGYWRLGELSGSAAADSAGSNPGSYNGAVTRGAAGLLTGDADKAAAFPGTSESVIVPNSTSLSLTTAVSVEAWIKPASLPAAGAFRSVTSKPEAYSLQFNGPRLEFTIIQAGGVRRRLQAPAGAIVAGRVYHVVGTYDGATQRLYIDGAQSGAVALTGAISSNANPLIIASWSGWNEFFAGTVDEAAVYPVALTATQVTNHYSRVRQRPRPSAKVGRPQRSPHRNASPSAEPRRSRLRSTRDSTPST